MVTTNFISKSDIFFSCTEKQYMNVENTVPEHALVHVFSGSMTITDADTTYTVNENETIILNKHLIAKFTKHPAVDEQFKSVTILFSQAFLQKYYASIKLNPINKNLWPVKFLQKHSLLHSLFDSILPYYELHGEELPQNLTEIKLSEAITILRAIDTSIDCVLANFAGPGKIDLTEFMIKNYSFNIPIDRFAYLTGRSLASFKRDFQKSFNEPPQRWLLKKRLKQAHYLLTNKYQKPSDVYLEVGFENFSHFSTSFKQHFGYTPSSIAMSR